jgi:hypothetical protein
MIKLIDLLLEVLNNKQRIKLKTDLIPRGWTVDGWYKKEDKSVKLIRTNPTTNKIEIGVLSRDNVFTVLSNNKGIK